MQYQVPQFIDAEDKIIGPLSLKQFFYLVGAAGLSFLLYFTAAGWLWITLSMPILILGLALAFIKPNGRPFERFLGATLSFYWKPQEYLWQPETVSMPKTAETMRSVAGTGFSLENILSGLALKNIRQNVETKPQNSQTAQRLKELKDRFEVYQDKYGAQKAAHRIDYR